MTDDGEPRELDWAVGVEVSELDPADPTLSAEYAAIPTASIAMTIAAIQATRIGHHLCGRFF